MIPLSPQGSPPQSQLSNSSTFPPVSLGLLGDVNAFGDDPLPLQPELFPSVPQDGEEGRVYLPGGRIENNSVVEGEGNNNGDGCIASVDIKKKHASKNTRRVDMMRHLRVNLTDKFTALRLLIPQNGRASIIEDAIGYINELKRTVTELKALVEKKRISLKRPKMKDSPTKEPNASKNIDPYSRSSLRSSWIHRKSKNSEVDVRIIHDEVTVKLIQHKRINRLLFVSKALNELQLDLHHVSGRVIGDYYSYHFNSKERFYFSDSILPVFETGIPLLKQRLQKLPESDKIVAFPDDGAWKRFHKLLDHFPMVICNKVREGDNRIVRIKEGNPAGCHVVIVDDLVQSGGTLIECQKVLAAQGAAKVSADVTHDVFPKNFWERVVHKNDGKIAFSHFWITDSCPHTVKTLTGKAPFEVLSLAGSISNALQI